MLNIVMMFKNEVDLLPIWLGYHGENFGYNNLTVVDNGSDDPRIFDILEKYKIMGVNILSGYGDREDYKRKGDIAAKSLISAECYKFSEFNIPLDCDEFLAADVNGELVFTGAEIEKSLRPYIGESRVLRIQAGYDNNPLLPGFFRPSPAQKKCFFAKEEVFYLDHGSHEAQTKSGPDWVKTPIVYMHYHFKPYELIIEHAKEKLRPFIDGFDSMAIRDLPKNVAGGHLLTHLKAENSEDYYQQFLYGEYLWVPEFGKALNELGYRLPFSPPQFAPEGFNPQAYLSKNPDVAASGIDPAEHFMRYGRHEGRTLY